MRIETSIRKQLRLNAHTVIRVEEDDAMVVNINDPGWRLLRCGVCRGQSRAERE